MTQQVPPCHHEWLCGSCECVFCGMLWCVASNGNKCYTWFCKKIVFWKIFHGSRTS